MKLRLATRLIGLSAVFLFATSAARATTIRTGSGYGLIGGAETDSTPIAGTAEYLICHPTTNNFPDCLTDPNTDEPTLGGSDDLLLQILTPMIGPLQIVVPNFDTTSLTAGTTDFGLIDCGATPGQLGSVCTPITADLTCQTALASATVTMDGTSATITLPTACTDVANATFYFDQNAPGGFASLPGSTTATPEPNSLMLLALGLLPVAILFKRRAGENA